MASNRQREIHVIWLMVLTLCSLAGPFAICLLVDAAHGVRHFERSVIDAAVISVAINVLVGTGLLFRNFRSRSIAYLCIAVPLGMGGAWVAQQFPWFLFMS